GTPLGVRSGHQAAKPVGTEWPDVHVVPGQQSCGNQNRTGFWGLPSRSAASGDRHDRPAAPKGCGDGVESHAGSSKEGLRVAVVREIAAGKEESLDQVWKALSDPTRRAILDFLRDRSRMTTEIVESFPHLSRFGVMKHLEVLRQAQLVSTREAGRQR